MKVILGDICYPKSEAVIIPANSKGIMSQGIPERVVKAGFKGISKEAKEYITNNKIEVGQCFSTGPGRLKRRGVKRIYHSVIKRLQNDFTSIHVIRNALKNAMAKVVQDKMKSVTICGLGIEIGELDQKTIAMITEEICSKYENKIEIKIIDDKKEFIKEIGNLVKE